MSFSLVMPGGPFVERLQRHEELGIEETGGVAAIVRSAVLRHHRDDFRMISAESRASWSTAGIAGLQRHGWRHRGADPRVAFLERRQELAAERRHHAGRPAARNTTPIPTTMPAPCQRKIEHRACRARCSPRTMSVSVSLICSGSRIRCQHRRDRECRDQRARQGVAVGSRHRTEDLPFDALHGEQRHERRDRDRGGEQHGRVDLERADSRSCAAAPSRRWCSLRIAVGSVP